jgi:hypothetical protein
LQSPSKQYHAAVFIGFPHPNVKRSQYDAVFSIAARKSVVLAFAFSSAGDHLQQLSGAAPDLHFWFHTTWGAFSFPFIFLATDLTVRILAHRWRVALFLR